MEQPFLAFQLTGNFFRQPEVGALRYLCAAQDAIEYTGGKSVKIPPGIAFDEHAQGEIAVAVQQVKYPALHIGDGRYIRVVDLLEQAAGVQVIAVGLPGEHPLCRRRYEFAGMQLHDLQPAQIGFEPPQPRRSQKDRIEGAAADFVQPGRHIFAQVAHVDIRPDIH